MQDNQNLVRSLPNSTRSILKIRKILKKNSEFLEIEKNSGGSKAITRTHMTSSSSCNLHFLLLIGRIPYMYKRIFSL